jgi:hypothetical protein
MRSTADTCWGVSRKVFRRGDPRCSPGVISGRHESGEPGLVRVKRIPSTRDTGEHSWEKEIPMQWRKIGTLRPSQNRRALQNWLIRSTLVSVGTWIGGPTPAAAQNTGSPIPTPAVVHASDLAGITDINATNNSVIATAPFPDNANGVVVTVRRVHPRPDRCKMGQITTLSISTKVPQS